MAQTMLKSITIISSPYHVGFYNRGVGAGPDFIRSLGVVQALKDLGIPVKEIEIEPVDEFEGEIGRSFELFRRTSALVSEAHNSNSFPIVLSGNCSAAVGVAAGYNRSLRARETREKLGCIWFDAHDDYNTPDTVVSGYFDSQPIAMLAGECWKGILGSVQGHEVMDIREKLVHVGLRDVNEVERQRVLNARFDVVWGDENGGRMEFAGRLRRFLEKKDLGPTMLHFDVDALDISLGKANQFSVPGGLFEEDLISCYDAIVQLTRPVSLTVASFDPSGDRAENIGLITIRSIKKLVGSLINGGIIVSEDNVTA